jgi:hypothetical protein
MTLVGSAEVLQASVGIVYNITGIYTIAGGTARFAGAQGSVTMRRGASPATFLTSPRVRIADRNQIGIDTGPQRRSC